MKRKELKERELLSNQIKLFSGMLIQLRENDIKECFHRADVMPSYPAGKKTAHTLGEKLYS